MNGESNNYKVRHTYIRISAEQIITICCWTDILCLSKLNSSTLHGRTQYKGDQASAKLDLTFINVDLTCQTVIIGPDMYMHVHVHVRTSTWSPIQFTVMDIPLVTGSIYRRGTKYNGQFTKYNDVIGGSEALIRINFMLGTFHQPKSTLHKKSNFCCDKKCVSESIAYVLR